MANRRRHGAMIPTSVRSVAQRADLRGLGVGGGRRLLAVIGRLAPRRAAAANSSVARSRSSPRSSACAPISRRYGPSRRISSACRPLSTTRPWSSTRMRSAPITLDSRCARIKRRAPLRQPVERLLDHRLVLGIDRGQRLVEDQDRRVAQQRPRDRQALPLAARQLDAALADDRLVALRQLPDELVRVGVARRRFELGLRRVGLAEPQILLDRAVEQIGVLVHDRDQPAQRLRVERRADRGRRPGPRRIADRTGAAAAARPTICPSRSGRRCRSSRRPRP